MNCKGKSTYLYPISLQGILRFLNGEGKNGWKLCQVERIPDERDSDKAPYRICMLPSDKRYEHNISYTLGNFYGTIWI